MAIIAVVFVNDFAVVVNVFVIVFFCETLNLWIAPNYCTVWAGITWLEIHLDAMLDSLKRLRIFTKEAATQTSEIIFFLYQGWI